MLATNYQPFNQNQIYSVKNQSSLSQQLPDSYNYKEGDNLFALRQVQYPDDVELLYKWMHMPHVVPQWQLNKSFTDLSVYFEKMLADDHQRLYLIGINGQWVGYTEIYEGARDRLAGYYNADKDDLGWHLLLAESMAFGKGYLRAIMRMLTFFIFNHSPAKKVVGEPDATVKPYEVVAKDLCYKPQYLIKMPEKTAMLYYCERQDFFDKFNN